MPYALLLVDAQRNMLEGDLPVPAAKQVRGALERLLARARSAGAVVVHVQNDGRRGDPDEPGTSGWELAFAAEPHELVVRKDQADAFAASPELVSRLRDGQVDRVVIAGMQSNYCVAATAWGAMANGFSVELASGAHATYDEDLPAADISVRVERTLSDDGVKVVPAEDISFIG